MNPWLKRLLIAIPVLVVLFVGALLVYVNFIRADADPELTTEDLGEVFATLPTATPTGNATGDLSLDGTWAATEASEFGYRVEEVLFGVNTTATGRSNQIDGSLTIAGTIVSDATFTVDVASITSDDSRRDGQFQRQIMQTDQFPEATFTLTEPVDVGTLPAPGEQAEASATGDLTMHGVTRTVTFELTAQADAQRIGVLGNIPIEFADYDIDNPSIAGITTEDHGLLEFILVFEPA